VGRESASIDNTSTLADDYAASFLVTTGTSPTAGQIQIWAIFSEDGSNYDGNATGSDAGLTPVPKENMKLVQSMPTTSTSNQAYRYSIGSLARLAGQPLRKMSFFVTHNTAVNLNSTGGNHSITYTSIKYSSA